MLQRHEQAAETPDACHRLLTPLVYEQAAETPDACHRLAQWYGALGAAMRSNHLYPMRLRSNHLYHMRLHTWYVMHALSQGSGGRRRKRVEVWRRKRVEVWR
jgi:hypothetical protein